MYEYSTCMHEYSTCMHDYNLLQKKWADFGPALFQYMPWANVQQMQSIKRIFWYININYADCTTFNWRVVLTVFFKHSLYGTFFLERSVLEKCTFKFGPSRHIIILLWLGYCVPSWIFMSFILSAFLTFITSSVLSSIRSFPVNLLITSLLSQPLPLFSQHMIITQHSFCLHGWSIVNVNNEKCWWKWFGGV